MIKKMVLGMIVCCGVGEITCMNVKEIDDNSDVIISEKVKHQRLPTFMPCEIELTLQLLDDGGISLEKVGEEGSESWIHVWQTVSYDMEKLELYKSGIGDERFRKKLLDYIFSDIRVLTQTYTLDSLKTVPEVINLIGMLTKCNISEVPLDVELLLQEN